MMESPELSISVGEIIGVPKVSIRGCMDNWHGQSVKGVLDGFLNHDINSIVLDLTGLSFAGIDSTTSMINVLRSIGPEICVHVVASGTTISLFERASLSPCIRLYSSTDEIAECISSMEECFTSRWLHSQSNDSELPMAA